MNRFYIREDDDMRTKQQQIDSDFDETTRFGEGVFFVIGFALLLIVLAYCALWPAQAHAQGTCTVGGATSCFIGSKTTGEAPLATTLTWNVVGATSCTAGGAGSLPQWSGTIPCSGTRSLSGINVHMDLTITPFGPPTAGKMRVSWTQPTTNTNGTPLTNLGGYFIDYGTSAGALNQTINLAVPGASAYDVTGLAAGTWFVSVRAATSSCFPSTTANCYVSLPSNVASKAVTTTPGGALPVLTLALDPYLVPSPPTNVVVTEVTAFRVDESGIGTRVAMTLLRSDCEAQECTVVARVEQ